MPLVKGYSRGAVSRNIGANATTKPEKQIVVALGIARTAAKKVGKAGGYLAKKKPPMP